MSNLAPQHRYSKVAILLHWLLALALAFQLAFGFAMPKDASGFAAYQFHKSVGITILLLTLVRLLWRVLRRPPPPLEQGFGGVAAKLVHGGFYVVLILVPLSGWALVSTAAIQLQTVLFWTAPWPNLPLPSGLYDVSAQAHELLSWAAVALFIMHVAGALRHHLILRDRLLERMSPAGSAFPITLAILVVVTSGATLLLADRSAQSMTPQSDARGAPLVGSGGDHRVANQGETPSGSAEVSVEDEDKAPPTPIWSIQPGGHLGFVVSNGDNLVRGSFASWDGDIVFDPDRPEDAAIAIEVDIASASVGDSAMDDALRGAEFLALAANPQATWRATSVRRTTINSYVAEGMLTLKGLTRQQPVTFTLSGDGLQRGVKGIASIDRAAFNLGTGPSGQNLSPRVSLEFSFEAIGKRSRGR